MNQSNYAALLGFTQGNLTEVSSYQAAQPQQQEAKPQRTSFNPAFKFGPPAADYPNLRVTAVVKEATVCSIDSPGNVFLRCLFWFSCFVSDG